MQATRNVVGVTAAVMSLMITSCASGAGLSPDTLSQDPAPAVTTNVSPEGPTQTIEVDEPYANASLKELGRASDLAIQARVVEITHGIKIGEDRSVSYRQYTIKATDSNTPDYAQVFVAEEFDGNPIAFENQPILTTGDEAIWVLDTIAEEFGKSGFVLTSSNSIFPVIDGKLNVSRSFPAGKEASTLQPQEVLRELGG